MAPFLGHDGAVNDGEPPFTGAQNKQQLQVMLYEYSCECLVYILL
jgi:hypothetical protein